MLVQLPTGNTLSISIYEFFFQLKEDEVDAFYQSAIADDLGTYLDNPFSNRATPGKLDFEELPIDMEHGTDALED